MTSGKRKLLVRQLLSLAVCLIYVFSQSLATVEATGLPKEQRDVYEKNTNYYDVASEVGCAIGGSSDASTGNDRATEGFASADIKTFANLPITSTWDISDSEAEDWFLKQAGAYSVKTRYGLDSSNIGKITEAVKSFNVSPVFFYAYAVSEGGGAGGFINHYSSEAAGGGVGNAKTDAKYLADQSKIMTSNPSWIDAGNPVDFVPKDVQTAGNADFKNIASGSIGRAYIPATAATTWEVYFPNGLKKAFNTIQDYGAPLNATMQGIKTMGGDPLQGGAAVSAGGDCGTTGEATVVAGEGIEKAMNFAIAIAKNDGYGYDQATRTTGWLKWKSNPNCTENCGSFDCSSLMAAAITEAGYVKTNPNFATPAMRATLEDAGFKDVISSVNLKTGQGLQPGDILVNAKSHTGMYIGKNSIVAASSDERGEFKGGQTGDQTGKEIKIQPYYNYPWDGVFRAPADKAEGN